MRVLILFLSILIFLPMTVFSQGGLIGFFDDFEKGNAENWEPLQPEIWEVAKKDGNSFYFLKEAGKLDKLIRKPGAISLIKNLWVSDFTMTLKATPLSPDTLKGREVVLYFGYQDDNHYYYVHLSNYSDRYHNSILIVNGADRKPIFFGKSIARMIDSKFHNIRLRRHAESGLIEVYVDDFEYPIMSIVDKTFLSGRVGVGSFDDIGMFDDVRVTGIK